MVFNGWISNVDIEYNDEEVNGPEDVRVVVTFRYCVGGDVMQSHFGGAPINGALGSVLKTLMKTFGVGTTKQLVGIPIKVYSWGDIQNPLMCCIGSWDSNYSTGCGILRESVLFNKEGLCSGVTESIGV